MYLRLDTWFDVKLNLTIFELLFDNIYSQLYGYSNLLNCCLMQVQMFNIYCNVYLATFLIRTVRYEDDHLLQWINSAGYKVCFSLFDIE